MDDRCRPGRLDVTVRESRPGGDKVRMVVTDGKAVFEAGAIGVAPLYLTVAGSALIGSWDITELGAYASLASYSPLVATRLLTRRQRCSSETLFEGVHRLTERARAVFDGTHLTITYPPPHEHVLQGRRLRPRADPISYFDRLLADRIGPVMDAHSAAVAVELSGGVDSANVAVSAAGLSPFPVQSLGLLMGGEAGADQGLRRTQIVERLNLRDTVVPAAGHLPFGDPLARSAARPHNPDGDVYLEAFDVLRRRAADSGATVVLTGFGGDEMMAPHPAELSIPRQEPDPPFWLGEQARQHLADIDRGVAPVSPVPLATQLVFAARNPAYLRCGLWPIAPLADPALYEFGRSLPVEWRTDKALLRRRLAWAGFPESVTAPQWPESFGPVMDRALEVHGPALLTRMLERSLLIDAGLVSRAGLEKLLLGLAIGRGCPSMVYDMLALEMGLQSMCLPEQVGR
jgi:asparagine synthase (glutamine-hydrolysing)